MAQCEYDRVRALYTLSDERDIPRLRWLNDVRAYMNALETFVVSHTTDALRLRLVVRPDYEYVGIWFELRPGPKGVEIPLISHPQPLEALPARLEKAREWVSLMQPVLVRAWEVEEFAPAPATRDFDLLDSGGLVLQQHGRVLAVGEGMPALLTPQNADVFGEWLEALDARNGFFRTHQAELLAARDLLQRQSEWHVGFSCHFAAIQVLHNGQVARTFLWDRAGVDDFVAFCKEEHRRRPWWRKLLWMAGRDRRHKWTRPRG